MQRLSRIVSNEAVTFHGPDVEISGITADSRNVRPGYLFIAIPGIKHDGTVFIHDAIAKGAIAVLIPDLPPTLPSPQGERVSGGSLGKDVFESAEQSPPPLGGGLGGGSNATLLTTKNIRATVSEIAANFYPRQPETIVAVTGTSGKTSTAQFTREIWQSMGYESASIGTLGLITAKEAHYGSLTTPDAITLHRLLDECAGNGITHLAMEASSHGLALHRLDHVRLKAGGFTNLSHDHLDYHETMEAYRAAKLRLFQEILPPGSSAVLNADSPEFEVISAAAAARGLKVISYGKKGREIKLLNHEPDAKGQDLHVEILGKAYDIRLPLIGDFQAWNGLCALGLVVGSGGDAAKAAESLGKITGVPGRLQYIGASNKGGAVFVDYAHKPDALENVLLALRPHVASQKGAKLGVVFGCGGDRDKDKRPLMGQIAARLADWIIVTDDNPRHEEPVVIRGAILAGCSGGNVREIADRTEAIRTGIGMLKQGDVLVIAGKGHERGQIIGDVTHPFDDANVARKVMGL